MLFTKNSHSPFVIPTIHAYNEDLFSFYCYGQTFKINSNQTKLNSGLAQAWLVTRELSSSPMSFENHEIEFKLNLTACVQAQLELSSVLPIKCHFDSKMKRTYSEFINNYYFFKFMFSNKKDITVDLNCVEKRKKISLFIIGELSY